MGIKIWCFGSSVLLLSSLSANIMAEQISEASTPGSQAGTLDEIVITGTKEGAVNLQEVPSAVTAFTAHEIEQGGIDDIEDLQLLTPGLNLSRNGQSTRLYMRGIGSNLDFVGSDPSVTVHIDGVYQSRTYTVLDSFLNVEQIEILRGPQGTLYGRNSTGGTINIITKLPTEEKEAKVFAEVGTDNLLSYGGSVNGALAGDSVFGRFAIMQKSHDPYVENTADNGFDGLSDDDSLSTRGALRFILNDKSELVLRADYTDIDRAPGAYKPSLLATTGDPAASADLVNQTSDPWEMNVNFEGGYVENVHWGMSAEYSIDLSPSLKLISLTAIRDLDFDMKEDTDGSNLNILMTELTEDQEQLTEELRLHYNGDRMKAVGGLFYLEEEQTNDTTVNIASAPASWFDASNDVTAYALFGQGTYAVTPRLNGTFGLRYSKEEKSFYNVKNNNQGPAGYISDFTKDWDSWSPKASIDYTLESGTLLYGSVSRGFKSGGFNLTAQNAEFDPEKIWSYEIGAKMELMNSQLRTNVALFYYDYEDLQVQNFIVPGQITIENAANATIQGFEIENQWLITYDWLFELNYAYLDAEYDDYVLTTGDASGDNMIASPEHKAYLSTQYFQDINSGTITYRLEYAWQDDQFFTPPNQTVSKQEAYGLLNGRVSYNTADEKIQIQVYGRNLENKAYSTSSREFPAGTVGVTKDINPPRTFGIRYIHSF